MATMRFQPVLLLARELHGETRNPKGSTTNDRDECDERILLHVPELAWQIEYYENRAKRLNAQNRRQAAAKQESLVNKAGKRYKAKELIVNTTTLSSNGYETRILSDIGGKTVDRVWIEDVTALKECGKTDKQMKQEECPHGRKKLTNCPNP